MRRLRAAASRRRALGTCARDQLDVYRQAHRALTEAAGVIPAALASAPSGRVVIIDVAGMSDLNLRHGTVVGDRLLDAIESILRRRLPLGVVARLAGDQFVVVVPGATAQEPVEEQVLRSVEQAGTRSRRGRLVRAEARAGSSYWHDERSRRQALSVAGAQLGQKLVVDVAVNVDQKSFG